MVANVSRIKIGITVNIGVGAKTQKNILHWKTFIFVIALHVLVKMVDI